MKRMTGGKSDGGGGLAGRGGRAEGEGEDEREKEGVKGLKSRRVAVRGGRAGREDMERSLCGGGRGQG